MRIENGDIHLETNKKIVTEKIVARSSAGLLLEDDGGNYIKINDGGIVDLGKTSAISAYRSGTQAVATATYTKLKLNAELYDVLGEFDSSVNYRFTATKAGYYLVTGTGAVDNLGDADVAYVTIYKNGGPACYIIIPTGSSGDPAYTISDIIKLDVNDYIELWVRHTYGSNRDYKTGIYNNFLTIHKLS